MGKVYRTEPEAYCKMGDEVTPIYIYKKKKWFSEKIIEKVLTGRNCHNRLGQETDPNNHTVLFDSSSGILVKVISESGVQNYLKRARIVGDDRRQLYYDGLKNCITPNKPEIIKTEPLQPRLQIDIPYVNIERTAEGTIKLDYWNDKQTDDEKRKEVIAMLYESIKILL